MSDNEKLINEILGLSPDIRYVAVYDKGKLAMKQRGGITNESAGESDKYEELLVNPTLLKLASQRGNIDCGGLEYIIIRYGNFFVLLFPSRDGHVNIGIEPEKNPLVFVETLRVLIKKHNLH